MKNTILSTIFLFIAFWGLAQEKYFKLTPEWLVSVKDTTKNYVVVEVNNYTAAQLYNKAIMYVNERYKNPDAVLRGKIENEFLTFATHNDHMFDFRSGINMIIEVNYLTTVSFKENKIKLDFHDIDMTLVTSQSRSPFYLVGSGGLSWYVYKEKDHSLFQPNKGFKDKIELFFNNQTNEIVSYYLTTEKEEW
ncbi:MAG: hypothetical protein Q7U54_10680 [Bacteroidales bacterium]|nr:hypothetical protein [Bacteroidales bacterium]